MAGFDFSAWRQGPSGAAHLRPSEGNLMGNRRRAGDGSELIQLPRPEKLARPESGAHRIAAFGRPLNGLIALFVSWHRSLRDRRLLARLDDRALRELGIDRAVVDSESSMPSWRRMR
jgi:uncharacterized protein YjiS (DUF1127 family)